MAEDNDEDGYNAKSDISNTGSDNSSTGSDSDSTESNSNSAGSESNSADNGSSNAACATTLDTAELLETILLFLPLRDLLQAPRVCKSWSSSIAASIKAQRALFLEPQSDVTSLYFKWDCMSENPRPPWPFFSHGDWVNADTGCTLVPTLNPLLTRSFFYRPEKLTRYPMRFIPLHHNGIISPHWQTERGPHNKEIVTGPSSQNQLCAIHRLNASWREMFVMQPPCEELSFICPVDGTVERDKVGLVVVSRDEGVRMGDVVNQLRDHWNECPMHTATRHGPHEGKWEFEGFLFEELQVFSEKEVDNMSAWDFVQHLEHMEVTAPAE